MFKSLKLYLISVIRLLLLMGYPLLLIISIGFFLIPFFNSYIREAIAFSIFTFFIINLVFVIKNIIIKKWVMLLSLWMLTLVAFIKLSFYYIFGAKLSSSSVFVLFETNFNEATEFVNSYFSLEVIGLAFVCFSYVIICSCKIVIKEKENYLLVTQSRLNKIRIVSVVLMIISSFVLYKRFKTESIVFVLSKSIQEYKETKANIRKDLAQGINPNISVVTNNNNDQIGVVIIGESTSRWHMELYGYNRSTNPSLTDIKEELFVFNDVIAPDVMTIRSLEKVLTLKCYENSEVNDNVSVVQLANQANYETYWISNQQPVGYTESIPTIIGSAAQSKQFIATDSYAYTIYDEDLLVPLENALKSEGNRKLVFIHLIGTHRVYKKRYPDDFSYFTGDNPITKYKTEYSRQKVNEYDNAIRYNDYVVREIIEKVRAIKKSSFVVYFSDHGDDVFDTIDFVGHHGSKASKPMHDVPFIAWFSEKYRDENPRYSTLKSNLDKPYALEDFIYSFADLINIDFETNDSTRSIFSYDFKEKTRWIKNEIDYDKWD